MDIDKSAKDGIEGILRMQRESGGGNEVSKVKERKRD